MAKSIRSKRKRKLRAERREKLKPKLKERLEKMLGVNDKETGMEVEGVDGEKVEGGRQDVLNSEVATGSKEAKTDNADGVEMKSEDAGQEKFGKKPLKRINKRKNLKRLGNKKRKNHKIFKW